MIIESGRIIAIEPDGIWVETIQKTTCESCSAKAGCGQAALSSIGAKTAMIRVLPEPSRVEEYQLHELVEIGIPERVIASGSLLVYMVPLIAMVASVLVVDGLGLNEFWVAISGVVGLLAGGAYVKRTTRNQLSEPDCQPVIVNASGVISSSF